MPSVLDLISCGSVFLTSVDVVDNWVDVDVGSGVVSVVVAGAVMGRLVKFIENMLFIYHLPFLRSEIKGIQDTESHIHVDGCLISLSI